MFRLVHCSLSTSSSDGLLHILRILFWVKHLSITATGCSLQLRDIVRFRSFCEVAFFFFPCLFVSNYGYGLLRA